MGGKESKSKKQDQQSNLQQQDDPNKPKPDYCKRKPRAGQQEEPKPIEYFGVETSPHLMIVEFCSGCGFYRYASSVAEKIEKQYPGQFYIELRPDNDQTGRLDVTVFVNQENKSIVDVDQGKKIHATEKGDDIPYKDWDTFLNKVDKALLGL